MAHDIGPRIAELRLARGLSQEALANELGISRQAVSRWERGEALPDTENLIALANLFGVTLDELVHAQAETVQVELEVKEDEGPAAAEEPSPAAAEAHMPPWLKQAGIAFIFVGIALIFIGGILRHLDNTPFGMGPSSPGTREAIPFENALSDSNSHADIDGARVRNLNVSVTCGDVYLELDEDNAAQGNVRVFETFGENGSQVAAPIWSLEGGTLRIKPTHPEEFSQIWVYVPVDVMGQLEDVDVAVGSGVAMLHNVVCSNLELDVGSGGAFIYDAHAVSLDVECASGKVVVSEGHYSFMDIQIASGSGDVIVPERAPSAIEADVASGELTLHLPRTCAFTLEEKTPGSNVSYGFNVVFDGGTATYGDSEPSTSITISTGSGTVSIQPFE